MVIYASKYHKNTDMAFVCDGNICHTLAEAHACVVKVHFLGTLIDGAFYFDDCKC